MQGMLIVVLAIVAVAVVFALQNVAPVTVRFFAWQFAGSLSMILLIAFTLGVIASILASLPSTMRKNKLIAERENKIREMEKTLIEYRDSFNPPDATH